MVFDPSEPEIDMNDKEIKNATDDEYVHDEPLKCENIISHKQENIINRL